MKSKSKSKSKSNLNQVPDQNPPPSPSESAPSIFFMPNAPLVPEAPQRPQLNCSHFKPEYVGKPDEDAEAHLQMTGWTHTNFQIMLWYKDVV